MRSLVSWESNATGPTRKFHPDQPVQSRQAGLPVESVANPTSLIQVCSFQGAEPTSQALFQDFLDFSRIPGLGIIIPNSEKLGLLHFLCVCEAIRRSMTDSHASLYFYVFLHRIMHVFTVYSASMSGNSLNRSRGDIVGSGKPKKPLGLTPREVAESPSWLSRVMDGLLSPTQVVSRVFTFFGSHGSVSFYRFL
ncbi:hypothetical protein CRG98_017398 [Punica granatum]|uniref:Uncharacterized protein n=1 Tax=Punica granatum TaxID=22663 RepID=A0A2I0K3D4_PUNGR|nr:hypothetical protein CRG98_017398 [Punica granatum]